MYGLNGYHKLVRVSPFGKGDKLHTSLCKVSIYEEKIKNKVVLNEADLRIDYYKAPGPGGQNKNKSVSAVRLLHVPTKIIVTSSAERSQLDNKKLAYNQMQLRLEDLFNNKIKQEMNNKRNDNLNNDNVAISYYYNHKFVMNESTNKKSTLLKDVLNGEISLIL